MDPESRFEALHRAHADAVHAYALRRTSPAAADDIVAETFLAVWRRLSDARGRACESTRRPRRLGAW